MFHKKISILICLFILTCILPFSEVINGEYLENQKIENERSICNYHNKLKKSDHSKIIVNPEVKYRSVYIFIPDGVEQETWDDSDIGSLPDSWDWRNYNGKDWTTSIKNQGMCGSCWDFAALGTLESKIKIKNNLPNLDIDLSEQYLLSCANIGGCDGSSAWLAYNYIKRKGGIIPESCLPYQASDDTSLCSEKCPDWKDRLIPISSYGFWLNPSKEFIKNELINNGPLVSSFVIKDDFLEYNGGYVYEHPGDESSDDTNHEVIIIGYDDNKQCWICKNSWGKAWGETKDFKQNTNHMEGGWFRIAYDDCKVGSRITYVNLDEVPIFHVKILKPRYGLYQGNQKVFSDLDPGVVFENFDVKVEAYSSESPIEKVEFYLDDKLKKIDYSKPYIWNCNEKAIFDHRIKALAYCKNGNSMKEEISIAIFNLGNGNNEGVLLTGNPDNANYKKWSFSGFIPELLYNPRVTDNFFQEFSIDYDFRFGDGQTAKIENKKSAIQTTSNIYNNDDIYNVDVEVTLKYDATLNYNPPIHLYCEDKGTGRMIIEVNKDYIPLSTEASGSNSGEINKPVQFQGVTKGGTPPYQYSWDFDISDGITEDSSEQEPNYSYQEEGTYVVTLTVTDNDNNKAIDVLEIEIKKDTVKSKIFLFTEKILILLQRYLANIKPFFIYNLAI